MKLDEKIWRQAAMIAVAERSWGQLYDGSVPQINAMMQLSADELQERYLEAIKNNQAKGLEGFDIYWKGDVWLYRTEMDRRLKAGLVSFETAMELKDRTREAVKWCVGDHKVHPKKGAYTIAAEAVKTFFPTLSGNARKKKIDSIRHTFLKKTAKPKKR
jgi:hypothetical protein